MGGVRLGSKQWMYICVLHVKDWFDLFVTGGMGGIIVVLLSQEGCKDIRCYYCVIVTGVIGVIIMLLSLEGYEMYYCVIVRGGIGVINVLLSQEGWVLSLC